MMNLPLKTVLLIRIFIFTFKVVETVKYTGITQKSLKTIHIDIMVFEVNLQRSHNEVA